MLFLSLGLRFHTGPFRWLPWGGRGRRPLATENQRKILTDCSDTEPRDDDGIRPFHQQIPVKYRPWLQNRLLVDTKNVTTEKNQVHHNHTPSPQHQYVLCAYNTIPYQAQAEQILQDSIPLIRTPKQNEIRNTKKATKIRPMHE